MCGCCAADCPDVHGEEAEERRVQFWRDQRAEEHEIARIVNERQHEHPRPLSELATKLALPKGGVVEIESILFIED